MEALFSLSGIAGAVCCVGMYAAVSAGKVDANKPAFFIVNGFGALLILFGASSQFDAGDIGTVGQELIWALISFGGAARVWWSNGGATVARGWGERTEQRFVSAATALGVRLL